MRETRIIFLTDYLTTKSGGVGFLYEVMKKIAGKYRIDIIAGRVEESLQKEDYVRILNLNVYRDDLPSAQPENAVKFLNLSTKMLKRIVKCTGEEELILHFNNHFPNLIPWFIVNSVPKVCSIHHLEETAQFSGVIPKLAKVAVQDVFEVNSPCTVVLTVSKSVRQKLASLRAVRKGGIVVIPPGIDTGKYLSVRRDPEENTFIMVGRLEKRKHYDHAIVAFKAVAKAEPNAKLLIVGEGPLRPYLAQLIRKFSLVRNVQLLGSVSEEEKLSLLSKAQALIHLGYPEGFGIVLIEALAAGVPVIAYDIPPLNEVVEHGATGILVPKDDVRVLARAIVRFNSYTFEEKTLRKRAERYDINIIAREFARLYDTLACCRRNNAGSIQ
ncbi:glycosyltransferase family 4 protein [Thermofilum pendens]|uniref:Glycosyl transferase, group 1 n=1 Tax=Thermofilum pendens (strain DSM 2475 / Hrk 5) TaxID=368408 RepID=A1S0Y9_THEPD|nr:glycosyltransferase family 4 protein [Thermofilum pendens]ABL79119.1 glycosyl transferase, group 1 [Thermofilum pendens Hrk 5]